MAEWKCFKCWKSHDISFWTNSRHEATLEADRVHAKMSPDCHSDIKITMDVDAEKLSKLKSPSLFEN